MRNWLAAFGISATFAFVVMSAALTAPITVWAQGRGAPQPARTPKQGALVDVTGYWVSIVSEDWRFRMVTAPKGDYPDVPLNAEGKKIADAWNPAKDEASGDRCRAYGAPNLMRIPARFHITWADDTTLKIESDAGRQTRLIRFNPPSGAPRPSRQGLSIGRWDGRGALKVVTNNLLAGYLQTNGVPYGAKATMTEFFDVLQEENGSQWLLIDAIVEDPQYLARSFIRSTHFRKQADGAGWEPSPCLVK